MSSSIDGSNISKEVVEIFGTNSFDELMKRANSEFQKSFTDSLHDTIMKEIDNKCMCQNCGEDGIASNPYTLCAPCMSNYEESFILNT